MSSQKQDEMERAIELSRILPCVGDIVLYRPSGHDALKHGRDAVGDGVDLAAMVCGTDFAGVRLQVFKSRQDGSFFVGPIGHTPLEAEAPVPGTWRWKQER